MPTYNEAQTLPMTLTKLLDRVSTVDVLVVDDGSPDGTGALADEMAAANPRVSVMHRTSKDGLGAAYLAGFSWGLERGYDVICEMDADGSHRAADLPLILDELEANPNASLVLGSRWVPGGAVENWPKHREFLSRGGNTYVRVMLDLGLKDATGGFRAYRSSVLKALDFDQIQSHGYCFQVDMARSVLEHGGEIREVPITFVERTAGESKMSGNIVAEALLKVTGWGVEKRSAQFLGLFKKN
ncbi:polyprenol monophosphomannose synthase [Timonella senegalensis]|uniref:polyprenol monophosphomannose synthase n=1 Tax=Timonella senegalensis TaxID=1465825 RepID=UPI0028A77A21|nr:polyprenol monophosphomannose synthase [Timonella senegalensis]